MSSSSCSHLLYTISFSSQRLAEMNNQRRTQQGQQEAMGYGSSKGHLSVWSRFVWPMEDRPIHAMKLDRAYLWTGQWKASFDPYGALFLALFRILRRKPSQLLQEHHSYHTDLLQNASGPLSPHISSHPLRNPRKEGLFCLFHRGGYKAKPA